MQKFYFSLLFSLLCGISLNATSLTFTLDLRPTDCQSTPPTPGTVEVFGFFASNMPGGQFSTGPFTLTDPDGDNVWTYTLDHPNGGGTANTGTLYAQYRYRVGGVDEDLNTVNNTSCSSGATPNGREKFVGSSQIGATGSEYWETCSGTACVVLPVELSMFKAENDRKGTVALQWQTATELNNEGFAIEHSTDGRNFEKLDFINGSGTTYDYQDYAFSHATPAAGKNYYRLKQIDFDGAFSMSEVLTVDVRKENLLSVQPSLVSDFVQVNYANNADTEVTVFNQTGQIVATQTINAGANSTRLDVSELPKGLYFLTANTGQQKETVKFVKK